MRDSQIEQVKQKVDIVNVIGERVKLKKAGRNFKGLCPFHGEKTPSFFVTPDMQIYKCFGCGVSGDVLAFLQAYEGLTFGEALEQLASKAGVKLTKRRMTSEDVKRERWLEVLHLADEYYHYLLTEHKVGEKARQYLKERGVYKQSIRDFHLGYAPNEWRGLVRYLTGKKKYKLEELEEVGLVIKSRGRANYYDRFRGRVMFPLKSYSGKVVGFSGRLLEKEAKEAKYINSPETKLYHKGEMLFGLSKIKSDIKKKDRVVVVEGEMDVISSYQIGLKEIVAIKGSALTENQVLQLRKLTRNVILALDADDAGQAAMQRGIETAEKQGMNLRIVELVEGKDPDDLARKDAKLWKALVDKAESVYGFYLNYAVSKFGVNTGLGQKRVSQFLAPIYNKIENAVERAYWVRKLAKRLEVSIGVVEEELKKEKFVKSGDQEREIEKGEKRMSREERIERFVVGALMQFENGFKEKLESLDVLWFSESYLKKLVKKLKEMVEESKYESWGKLMVDVPEEMRQLMEKLYLQNPGLLEQNRSMLKHAYEKAIVDLKRQTAKKKLLMLSREMGGNINDESKLSELRIEYRKYSKWFSDRD